MFTFSVVSDRPESPGCKATLLSFDSEIRILADPSWNGQNPDDILFLEDHLRHIDFVLLSHSTPEFIGGYALLCAKFPHMMQKIPVYATLPVNQLGRISTVEFYRSKGFLGPLDTAIVEVSDVDEWFDKVVPLKFFQTVSLCENRLVVTPYNAGHTLGGTFWLLTKRLERIVYAPSWNHSKDSFLNSASFLSSTTGNPLASLSRPTALITSTDLGSTMSHKKRTEKFLQLVSATLANGGAVLLPTSISGRFLELLHLVDEHLQGAPIAIYFLSYSGTKVLTYASGLLEWMSTQLIKDYKDISDNSAGSMNPNKNNLPFDPSKVDLLLDPNELIQLPGPKIIFCSGVDINSGDLSAKALQYVCKDEKTTIILTEKTPLGFDESINAQLYNEWFELAKKKNGGSAEDGIAVPLERTIPLTNFTREEGLSGNELRAFREKVTAKRRQQLLAKARDKKNQNLLNADSINDDDSSSDDEEEEEDQPSSDEEVPEQKPDAAEPAAVTPAAIVETKSASIVNELTANEAFIADHVKQSLEANRPLDIKITQKLKPRQAMFPYTSSTYKQKFDDYGETIDAKDFQRNDDSTNTKLIEDSKRKFEQNERKRWGDEEDQGDENGYLRNGRDRYGPRNGPRNMNQNKLTPQETLNNQVLQKNLDTLFSPAKRVPLSSGSRASDLAMRCGLSFVDLSGTVDLRSMSLIVSSLKPYNLLLLPDAGYKKDEGEPSDFELVKAVFTQQQADQESKESRKSLYGSSRFLSLSTIRSGQSNVLASRALANKMNVFAVEPNSQLQIGGDGSGVGLSDFEIKLDDKIMENLKWQNIDGSYRVAQVFGELEVHNQEQANKKQRTVADYINSYSQFTLKYVLKEDFSKKQQKLLEDNEAENDTAAKTGAPRLAIGNIRLPDLKKKLIARNLNAEFKGEGTLVVNDEVAIRKVTYTGVEGDDTGDIVIDGLMGPLYYEVKDCIRDMLAYV